MMHSGWRRLAIGLALAGVMGCSSRRTTAAHAATAVRPRATISSLAPLVPGAITRCGQISQPGAYTLGADLTATAGDCVRIASVPEVTLNCQGHVVPGLSVSNVTTLTIANCVVSTSLELSGAAHVLVSHATIRGELTVSDQSSSVVVSDSSIQDSLGDYAVQIVRSTGVVLTRDSITSSKAGAFESVTLNGGSHNQVLGSTLTGGYDGGPADVGTTDGIVVVNETDDTIRGNTVHGFSDAAVEGLQTVSDLLIADNRISTIGTAAVGNYWCTSWTRNAVEDNDVSRTPLLLLIANTFNADRCGTSTPPPFAFTANRIVGNRFHDPAAGVPFHGETPARVSVRLYSHAAVADNTIADNDFGALDGPFLAPVSGFIDGGGNVCGPINPAVSNFACAASPGRAIKR